MHLALLPTKLLDTPALLLLSSTLVGYLFPGSPSNISGMQKALREAWHKEEQLDEVADL